ncbi:16S rRNA (cytosine(1402)-N(4))-methyltransferase RsmH [Candidatus Uhrbacteria bacterium]|nr:16S rRNA (cytosine(1402)-N(4))-methyltransferase RsmH [Candidatus Uhrbacteria bacterium]
MAHVPVMMAEVLKFLDPKQNQNFIDCTLGDGGHAFAVLERIAPDGRLLGIDADEKAIEHVTRNTKHITQGRLVLAQGNFRDLGAIVKEQKFGPVHGILLDLGFSSSTLERGRGFSFEKDELLDMRFDTTRGIRAAEIVNGWNQAQLAELLREYGEERLAREIAAKIVEERKKKAIVTSGHLAEVVVEAYRERLKIRNAKLKMGESPRMPWIGGIHPATRTFQALRIAVNDELNALQEVLPQAVDVLEAGGRLAVIAFHSLEDRIVKQFFREWADTKMKLLTKKPIVPTQEEIKNNPRAGSAKLRVIEKL